MHPSIPKNLIQSILRHLNPLNEIKINQKKNFNQNICCKAPKRIQNNDDARSSLKKKGALRR